jgi:hypothetical protein
MTSVGPRPGRSITFRWIESIALFFTLFVISLSPFSGLFFLVWIFALALAASSSPEAPLAALALALAYFNFAFAAYFARFSLALRISLACDSICRLALLGLGSVRQLNQRSNFSVPLKTSSEYHSQKPVNEPSWRKKNARLESNCRLELMDIILYLTVKSLSHLLINYF